MFTQGLFLLSNLILHPKVSTRRNKMNTEKIVRVGLGLYIFNDKHPVLLGLRKSEHGQGTWCPPGGHMEYGESFEEGAVRETKEETGLLINPKDVIFADITNDFFKESGKHYVTFHMTTHIYIGEPYVAEPEKCEGWQWFDINELPENMFLPAANFLKRNKLSEY